MTQFKLALDKYLSSAQSFDTNEVEHDDEDGSAQHPEPTLSETTPLTEAQKDGDISSRELHTPARLAKDGDVSSSELHTPARLANDGDVSSRELHTPARLAKNNSRSHSSVDVDVPRGASLKASISDLPVDNRTSGKTKYEKESGKKVTLQSQKRRINFSAMTRACNRPHMILER
eukprot:g57456.t1